jgi:hypothetical protein
MKINKIKKITQISAFSLITLFLLTSCEALKYRKADAKDYPINDADKRAKNMEEGRKITFGNLGKSGSSGTFDFASSNELWRATIDVLEFVPLVNADYGGGIIITDWYSENENTNEAIKISIQFLSNEVRSDALKVSIYNKKCIKAENCKVLKVSTELNSEIKLAILKKAASLKNNSLIKKK